MDVVHTILDRSGSYPFPTVSGIITTPTLRPDGSILSVAGYDASTRLLLVAPPQLPTIPEKLTREHAKTALTLIDELLSGFPFVDEVARSAARSSIITPVVRGAFTLAPMHIARAPVAGSGKSYLFDLAALIATGQFMPVVSAGRTEEETEKRLDAALLSGQAMLSIDNVNGELGGAKVCMAVERPSVKVRVLGKSELVLVESKTFSLYATGNNIVLRDDLIRRTITARMDPRVERPELRKFVGNPVKTVLEHSAVPLSSVRLILVRAFAWSNGPCNVDQLGSFGDWSDVVRSALIWLDCADPVDSMETARREDPTTNILRDVLTEWADTMGVGEQHRVTIREFMNRARENDQMTREPRWPELATAIRNAAPALPGRENSKFGQWVGLHQDRILDNLALRQSKRRDSSNATLWWVEDLTGATREGKWTPWVQGDGRRFGVVDGGAPF